MNWTACFELAGVVVLCLGADYVWHLITIRKFPNSIGGTKQ